MRGKPLDRHMVMTLIGEVVFAAAPIAMVFAVLLPHHPAHHVFASPEWAIAGVILCGQALVKFQVGLMNGPRTAGAAVGLTVILLLFLGVIPASWVLYKVLDAHEGEPSHPPELWVQIAQVFYFAVGVCVYVVLGAIGEAWRHQGDDRRPAD